MDKCLVDVCGFSETKLDSSFPDTQFQILNYNLYRNDRNCRGGGVMVFIRNDIPTRRRKDFESANFESVVLQCTIGKKTWFIVNAYKPPKLASDTFEREFSFCVDKMLEVSDNIVLLGDLNCNMLKTPNILTDMCDIFDLKNIVREPTCITKNSETLLDVILTSKPRSFINTLVADIGISDFHKLVATVMRSSLPKLAPRKIHYRSYKNFNEHSFLTDLEKAPFQICHIFNDVDDQIWACQSLFSDIVNKHAPLKCKIVKGKGAPFMNSELRKSIHRRNMLRNKYLKQKTNSNWENYRRMRNACVKIRKKSVKQYFQTRCTTANSNSSEFWKTIKPFLPSSSNSGPSNIILNENNTVVSAHMDIANIMNDYFVNVASDIGSNVPNLDLCNFNTPVEYVQGCVNTFDKHPSITEIQNLSNAMSSTKQFSFQHTNPATIFKSISNIDPKKSTGVDTIPAKLIKLSAHILSQELSPIFNETIDKCSFPLSFKRADVSPVFKKEDSLSKTNYRPISLLPCLSKNF